MYNQDTPYTFLSLGGKMITTHIPFESELHLFHQATKLPICLFNTTPNTLLQYPLIEAATCSPITLIQCCNILANSPVFFPLLFASDSFFFALIKADPFTNIMLGPVASVPLTYKEFYESNKSDCNSDDLTLLYRIIQQSPHISLSQFAGNICLLIKLIEGKSISIQDVLSSQREIPKQHYSISESEISEYSYTSVNEVMSFQKTILYHIQNGHINEIKRIFQEPNFFNNMELIPSSVGECHKIFFVYATLCCVTAIEEGLDTKRAFPLFDTYISKIPSITSQTELSELCMSISLEYCQQIIRLREYQSDSPVITQCLQYIHEHIHSKITVDDLATHCNLSKRSITRHFTAYYHTSVSEYILNEKLKEAAFLLTNSCFSLTEISHQLAFSSQSHLSVAFKKKYFYTPQQYRDKYKSHKKPIS